MNSLNELVNIEEEEVPISHIDVLETICDLIQVGLEENKRVKCNGYWEEFLENKRMKKRLGKLKAGSLKKYTTMIGKVSLDEFDKIMHDNYQILKATNLRVKNLIELITGYVKLEEKPAFENYISNKKMKKKSEPK